MDIFLSAGSLRAQDVKYCICIILKVPFVCCCKLQIMKGSIHFTLKWRFWFICICFLFYFDCPLSNGLLSINNDPQNPLRSFPGWKSFVAFAAWWWLAYLRDSAQSITLTHILMIKWHFPDQVESAANWNLGLFCHWNDFYKTLRKEKGIHVVLKKKSRKKS